MGRQAKATKTTAEPPARTSRDDEGSRVRDLEKRLAESLAREDLRVRPALALADQRHPRSVQDRGRAGWSWSRGTSPSRAPSTPPSLWAASGPAGAGSCSAGPSTRRWARYAPTSAR